MESLRKNLSAYTLDDAPEDVRELYKDEFIQLYTEMTVDEFEEEAKEAAKDMDQFHGFASPAQRAAWWVR